MGDFVDQSTQMLPDANASGWWNHTIGDIALPTPCTVTPDMPCQDVVNLLKDQGFDQLPVVDKEGEIHGVVTETNLLSVLTRIDLINYIISQLPAGDATKITRSSSHSDFNKAS